MPKRELNTQYVKDVSKGFKIIFDNALKLINKDYERICTIVEANTATVDYSWMADLPSMREWIGDRELKTLSAWNYSIRKKDWESSIKVPRDVIEYDNLGIVKPQIISLADGVWDHYCELVYGLLEKNETCYDGKKFFAKDHSVGSTTFSNLGNLELNKENFNATVAEMGRIANENGRSLKIRPNLIIVPTELEATAEELFKSDTINGSTNTLKGKVDILVCDDLSNKKAWYLLDVRRAIKPLILQINQEPRFAAMDSLTDEAAFMRKEFRYGVDTQDNAGYGLWQLAYANLPS